jgi:hypothetical protein
MKKFTLGLLALFIVPLISAYNHGFFGRFGGYGGPSALFQNEWVIFGIIFLVFFALIFYSLNKRFDNNAVSAIVAGGISLIIAMSLSQRVMYTGFFGGFGGFGEGLGNWIMFLAIVFGIFIGFKFIFENFGPAGSIPVVVVFWYLLGNMDIFNVLPYGFVTNEFLDIYEFIISWPGLFILLVISIYISSIFYKRKKDDDFMIIPRWGRRR